jgi:YD repeat-containing protein
MHRNEDVFAFFQNIIIWLLLMGTPAVYAAGPTYVGGTYSSNQTWTPDGSPYIVTSNISLANCATLTITTALPGSGEAPVEVKFNAGTGMRIGGYYNSKQYGYLIAQGSASCPITFTTNTGVSYWKGISFMWTPPSGQCSSGLYSKLSHCIIEKGGADDTAFNENGKANISNRSNNVLIEYCTIRDGMRSGLYYSSEASVDCYGTINNCIITNNQEMGLRLEAAGGSGVTGVCYPTIKDSAISHNGTYGLNCNNGQCNPAIQSGNTFEQNGSYPLRIPAIMRIDGNNTFIDNGQQAIEVLGRGIFQNSTWHNFGIPYIIRGSDVTIPNNQDVTLTLTIDPGTTIRFDPGTGLNLGRGTTSSNDGFGILNAQGTKEQPIVFTSTNPGQYWEGITFIWNTSSENSRLNYCTIEYAGQHKAAYSSTQLDGAVLFQGSIPSSSTLQNSTIRYSISDGIRFYDNYTHDTVNIHNCNFYSNALYDIVDTHQYKTIYAQLNFWGTLNGPSQDFCSSAVVDSTVRYKAWLEKEATDPLKFTAASASAEQFNPLTGSTTISFSLSQSAIWKVSIVNEQEETVWSRSGSGTNGSVVWNGIGDNGGTASGVCFYRIEAENSSGTASPARGVLYLGQQAKARITEPDSGSLFTPGAKIIITGTAQPEAGQYYEVQYGSGENPASWVSISGPVYASRLNGELAVWDTAGIDQPVGTVRLDVHTADAVYTDIVRVGFFIAGNQEPETNATTYRYDALGRLIAAQYPDSSAITYTYDRAGNRLAVNKTGQAPPTAVTISSFSARPTLKGVIIKWETETENKTAGFNLYRKSVVQGEYQKINTALIPAQGSATTGTRYSYTDVPPRPGNRWQYLLEEVETGGATNRYGPAATVNRALRAMSGTTTFRKTLQTNCD